MLVCNVSLRPVRRAIAADIAEITTALDNLGSGQAVFASLVDDPASVIDIVDAYSGEIMVEATSAADVVEVGLSYVAAMDEAVTASHAQDATIPAPTPYVSWNPADVLNIILSNSNLTATNTGGSVGQVRTSGSGASSGKYYFEITMSTWSSSVTAVGVGPTSVAVFFIAGASGSNGIRQDGGVYTNGIGPYQSLGTRSSGDIIGVAVDLTAMRAWYRVCPSGNWNGNASYDPATGTGGVDMAGVATPMFPFFTPVANGDAGTGNFGASAFSGAMPSGFSVWP